MAVYTIKNAESLLSSVEFTPVSDGNFTFFHVKDPARVEAVRQWLTSKDMGQEIVADTRLENHAVIVTHGQKTRPEMLKVLEERGEQPELKVYRKPVNYWAIRGGMSIVGQCLQLASASLQVEKLTKGHAQLKPTHPYFNPKLKEGMWVRKGFSADIGAFAILNLTANAMNMIYGGQKEEATNQLHAIKSDLNANLNDHVTAAAERTFDISDNRAKLHKDDEKPKSATQKTSEFLQKHSVRIGEIGLRYLGAMALVFPTNRLGSGWAQLKQGNLTAAWNAAKNPATLTLASGGGYLLGKTLALFAKVPDPYDTTPRTALDTIREDYLFKVGGLIEAVAGGTVGYNAFSKKKIGFSESARPDMRPQMDYLGGIGGMLFAAGYVVRLGAKFGSKHLDTEEVFAHATDTLAKTRPEELPKLMAECSATLKEHLKDTPIEYSEIFTRMMTDMYRYHHIALDNLGTEPEDRNTIVSKRLKAVDPDPSSPVIGKRIIERRTPADIAAAAPPASFADRAAQSAETARAKSLSV